MSALGSHRHQKENGIAVIAIHIEKRVFSIKKRKIKQEKHMVIEFDINKFKIYIKFIKFQGNFTQGNFQLVSQLFHYKHLLIIKLL